MTMPMKAVLLLLMTPAMLCAQMTRRESVGHNEGAKANSPSVPDAYALTGHFDRIVVMRLKFKTNLLGGMEKLVKQEHIQNGVILSAVGSVRGYEVHQVSNRDFPSHDTYTKDPTAPADLVSMNGYVINGRIHAHITLATPDKVIAGHLEPGTEVFTFALITVGVMNGTDLSKMDDGTYR
jgi:predicted DNA-binding protein with PD1-like motif